MTDLTEKLEALAKAADAWNAFVKARAAMNAAIPDPIHASPAERALYDERYRADHEAERVHWRTAIKLAQLSPAILRALRERDQAVEALRTAEAAIAEYYRYWTGGETRGSYDGKPERTGLWRAQNKARQALASIEGADHE